MTNYNDGKWHGWNGGECPVHPETVVEYAMRDESEVQKAKTLRWIHQDSPNDIIAFRVIKEHKGPREFWLVCGDAYDSFEGARENKLKHDEIIHVREVLE